MLRCRPTRMLLKQDDIEEYKSKRAVWAAEKEAVDAKESCPMDRVGAAGRQISEPSNRVNEKRQAARDRIGISEKM